HPATKGGRRSRLTHSPAGATVRSIPSLYTQIRQLKGDNSTVASMSEPTFIAPDPHIPHVIPRDVFAPTIPFASRHNYRVVIDRFEQALAAVEARIRVDPSSRVARWRHSLRRIAQADKRG